MSDSARYLIYGGKKTAYCPDLENYARSHKQLVSNVNGKKGDVALMDFGKGRASHTGIVEAKNNDGTYTIIEGNTSTSSNDNGGKVMRRTRKKSVIRGFYRPKYDSKVSASQIVSNAVKQLGVKESPSGSNKVKYNTWYYGKEVSGSAYPWCMAFVMWVFAHTMAVEAVAVSNATAKPVSANTSKTSTAGTSKNTVASTGLKYSKTVEEYQKAYNVSYSPKPKLAEDGKAGEKTKATFEKIDLYKGIKHKATIVKFIQKKVGADDDGDFGGDTEKKVKKYQKKYGIPNTGRVKKKTITKMVLG